MQRVTAQIAKLHWIGFLGLIRQKALRAAGSMRVNEFDSYAEDVIWLTKVACSGELLREPAVLYIKRVHSESTHGKWFRWERERRRGAWIVFCVGLLQAALPAASSDSERSVLLRAVLARLIAKPDVFALYRLRDQAERDSLLKDFFTCAEKEGVCTLRPRPDQGMAVTYGPF
jgi:hypothetical protein